MKYLYACVFKAVIVRLHTNIANISLFEQNATINIYGGSVQFGDLMYDNRKCIHFKDKSRALVRA